MPKAAAIPASFRVPALTPDNAMIFLLLIASLLADKTSPVRERKHPAGSKT
jgi:hypothetical protein